ncbi:guanylate kinase [Candidatus Blochmannia ocreatus (nom. nud.)]|uniref:Guanylate kinase n=1 Tax=Candidatus Blochmannia ocreatus (nom. nud.) TaxID=251538 RepID=A0ABY4SSY4_9ENTR|nr:guanylate kinase [Candidatus Blochmannia ocreatus]URJ25082.1 guanylate kinase [Candidatus Blochmannia ocreatus]
MSRNVGILCVISAPSGTGKSSLIYSLIRDNRVPDGTKLSISYTTRLRRASEVDGRDYYFISKKKFESMIKKKMLFEYARIFNQYYGTGLDYVQSMLYNGMHVILIIDWKGARQVREKILNNNIYTIFILPPSKEELARRLRKRGQDSEKVIAVRMKQAINEISHFKEYDYIVINDNFDVALRHLQAIMLAEQLKIVLQKTSCADLLDSLLV